MREELMIIERKSFSDLAGSLRTGDIEQSFRLNSVNLHNHNIVYLIEGNRDNYSNRYSSAIFNTFSNDIFVYNNIRDLEVFQTRNLVETAEYILRISNKLSREEAEAYYLKDNNDSSKTYTDVIKEDKMSHQKI